MNQANINQQRGGIIHPKIARIYLRVSTDEQDLRRQERIVEDARAAGCYVAAVYREKASGARPDRPELMRMISDLQPGELVIAEKMDRISRLPLGEADRLVQTIRQRGARLAVPGLVDLSEVLAEAEGVTRVVLEATQEMLLRLSLQMAREDYEDRRERQKQGIEQAKASGRYRGRKPNYKVHERIVALRQGGTSILETARLVDCSPSHVKKVWLHYTSTTANNGT
ncbi:recombinase family protein [Komagataeibacter rhaeticus]|uniref:Recombinase family protein n=1 Tax=Komagataeibacter rhaeticus TaxID=215221 RepID=A0A858JRH8_9PROT|nr:recombinase family protein [Komagataeibacter rhaeticus]ATU72968.1 resolvase [Komagataeibacter xylinus]QIP36828.1 recombinase family protein [Komagataeibacter rhaeticus]QOC46600.1 recombinase family protein [Komagataeibacter rhaeticus]WPP22778.1 recombinase family protein [Komagataeibacter rhaeticus]